MRAIEYISKHSASINHIAEIKRIIQELKPLRLDKNATDTYFNTILCADIRKRNFLLQQDLFNAGNAMQPEAPIFKENDKEIPIEYSSEIRDTLFRVIKDDESFGYLYFLLGTEQNTKHQSEPIDCIPNPTRIKVALVNHRDSYPHNRLDEYLDDDFNYEQYNMLCKNGLYSDDELLDFFNEVYYLYDRLRCVKDKMSSVRDFCKSLSFKSDKDNYFIISTIIVMIDRFESGDAQMMKCRSELYKMISALEPKFKEGADAPDDKAGGVSGNNERSTNKVKTVVIYELLKKLGKGKSQNDISKICRLVAYFTDGSEQGIYNDAIEGITLTKYHKAEIERVNKILDDLGLEITIKKDIQY